MGSTPQANDAEWVKLTPEMASFRLLALAFIRDYVGRTGQSPSYGEIAAALDSNRNRVRKAVKSLAEEGLIIRTPGHRGLALPSMREEAVRQLRALGWSVDEDAEQAIPPVTNPPLLPPAALTYPSRRSSEKDETDGDAP
ncbi:LexA family protein [Qipengyuania sp.]|uniref:LexA family protein n=1 Tax=Qipengyuania sp. TaxID=2004515 RepID=UPI0035C83D7F